PMNRVGAVAALSLLVLALVGASGVPLHTPGTPGLSPGAPVRDMATSGLNFDYLVTIIMENHNLCEIYTHCGGTGVYMTALADAYSISLQDSYCNVTRCKQVVPAGTAGSALVSDLASTSSASNYMWFTPDTCNDMHDCDVPTGDAYLSVLVPLILASNVFLTERAALLLTFDEGYG